MTENPYQTIKRSIADGIATGQWQIGQVLPSEHALVRQFHVSRMTVNRAMRELANENVIRRVPGRGQLRRHSGSAIRAAGTAKHCRRDKRARPRP